MQSQVSNTLDFSIMQPDSIFLQRTPQAHFAKQTIISVGQYENSLYLVCNAEKHACGKSEL